MTENTPDDSHTGYVLKVDLEYPKEIYDYHSNLPLDPENRIPDGWRQRKILTISYKKEKYVIHYRNLKQCMKMGLRLKKYIEY